MFLNKNMFSIILLALGSVVGAYDVVNYQTVALPPLLTPYPGNDVQMSVKDSVEGIVDAPNGWEFDYISFKVGGYERRYIDISDTQSITSAVFSIIPLACGQTIDLETSMTIRLIGSTFTTQTLPITHPIRYLCNLNCTLQYILQIVPFI
jgi:hypothetical protein